jgi:hypothetical protein
VSEQKKKKKRREKRKHPEQCYDLHLNQKCRVTNPCRLNVAPLGTLLDGLHVRLNDGIYLIELRLFSHGNSHMRRKQQNKKKRQRVGTGGGISGAFLNTTYSKK